MLKYKIIKISTIFFVIAAFHPISLGLAKTREPAVSGSFYPQNKQRLQKTTESFIAQANIKNTKKPFALISPHAGYMYSGPVAGYTYKLLKKYKDDFDTIIILGVNHHHRGFSKNSIYKGENYRTPLGEIKINQKITANLLKYYGIIFEESVHTKEHSIETQIPFIQTIGNFTIVPLVIGNYSAKNCSFIADVLINEIVKKDKKVLFLASSDFSHYKDYETAKQMDKKALDMITNLKLKEFATATYKTNEIELCGFGPVMILSIMAKKLGITDIETLKYLNSGDTKGSKDHVVGYAAVAFYANKKTKGDKTMDNTPLSKEEKKFLLETARTTITSHIKEGNIPKIESDNPIFNEKRGAFVTLHENGNLRGCIGYIEPFKPLLKTIIENSINASTNDLRFPRVTENELPNIDIEISVLTVPKETSLENIVLGRDGIILEKNGRSAVFLPQVAPEQGWDLETTLSYLAQKAGLSHDAWKDGCTFLTFEAEVFSENEFS